MEILGIETSCDETAFALYDTTQGLLDHCLHSQIDLHAQYGGVVPELASRDHLRYLLPLLQSLLKKNSLSLSHLEGIAYTAGPGLLGAVLVGASFGRSLAWALQKPAIGIHHLEGHLLAPMLSARAPSYPFISLIVSGGHTLLAKVEGLGQYQLLGHSLDDAAGEAFDKTARLLNLGYVGGAAIEKLAKRGNPGRFEFPRPMVDRSGLLFSFSGLKTSVANAWAKSDQSEQTKADIAYAFQEAVLETLCIKAQRAIAETRIKRLVVVGGVSANQRLRLLLAEKMPDLQKEIYFPELSFCTDNAAMIAYAGAKRLEAGLIDADLAIKAKARWELCG